MAEGFDVSSVCNVLVDLLIEVSDEDLTTFDLEKGKMHLVNKEQQGKILDILKPHHSKIELGGSSLNTIKALAQLGCKVSFSGMIGEDEYGSVAHKAMENFGISTHLQKHPNEATGKSLILVTPDGERTMNTHLGASSLYEPSLTLQAQVQNTRCFHFSGYQWSCETQRAIAKESIRMAKKNSGLVSFDLADPFMVEAYKDEFLELLKNDVDIFFGNREESRLLFEDSSPEDFFQTYPDLISVLKLDSEGALIYHKGEKIKVSPVLTEVVDSTGAGDMFAAGFLCGLSQKLDLALCGRLASILASDVISHFGATLSEASLEKISSEISSAKLYQTAS